MAYDGYEAQLTDKGRKLLQLLPLPYCDPERCFASRRAEADYYEQLLFSRIRSLHCAK